MTAAPRIAVPVRNLLGEGPVWLADRQRLVWCDIIGQTVLSAAVDGTDLRTHGFGEPVSAVFPVTGGGILIATASGLESLDLDTGARVPRLAIEADNPATRANDSRAAPGGTLWFSTMGRALEPGAGAVYHVARGRIRTLQTGVSIPNATCFSPDGTRAYFADTAAQQIMTMPVDGNGVPNGPATVFVDLTGEGLNPDGAVTDAEGALWNAQWGASRIARYRPDGTFDRAIALPARQITCPCFGGPDLRTLFVTSAAEGVDAPHAGAVFAIETEVPGCPERTVDPWW